MCIWRVNMNNINLITILTLLFIIHCQQYHLRAGCQWIKDVFYIRPYRGDYLYSDGAKDSSAEFYVQINRNGTYSFFNKRWASAFCWWVNVKAPVPNSWEQFRIQYAPIGMIFNSRSKVESLK